MKKAEIPAETEPSVSSPAKPLSVESWMRKISVFSWSCIDGKGGFGENVSAQLKGESTCARLSM